MFCSSSLVKEKKKRVNQRGVVDEYSHQDNRLDLEKEFSLVV